MSMDEKMSYEEKYRALVEEHDQVKGELMTVQLDKEELLRKYETEEAENKMLKEALAHRDDLVRDNKGSEDGELKIREILDKENKVLKNTNKMILLILGEQRGQLKKLFWEKTEKSKEAFKLQENIKALEWTIEKMAEEKAQMESESSEYAKTVRTMMEELNEQANKWEMDRLEMNVRYKENDKKLRKEIESLKAQKEDIVNHSTNSEKFFAKRIADLDAEIERFQETSKIVADLKTASKDNSCYAVDIQNLNKKLAAALEAIDELEVENTNLRNEVDTAFSRQWKAEGELNFQESLFSDERKNYLDDCDKYEEQIAHLNEEMIKLEEMRDKFRRDLDELTEKQTQQTVTFSNEKAKFCHDLERVEEKWHAEVVKLNKKSEDLETWLKDSLLKRDILEQKLAVFRDRTEEAEMLTAMTTKESEEKIEMLRNEIAALKERATKADARTKDTQENWDTECTELEDNILALLRQGKTREKRLKTMYSKYDWLIKATKKLSEMRRGELTSMKEELAAFRNENIDLADRLKEEMAAWKGYAEEHVTLRKKIEDLEKANEALEEKVEAVTETWRTECEIYEANMVSLDADRKRDKAEAMHVERKLQRVTDQKHFYEAEIHTMLQENSECSKLLREKDAIIKGFESMVGEMKSASDFEKDLLRNAIEEITDLHNKLEVHKRVHSTEKTLLMEEIGSMKKHAEHLRENLGVETIEDDGDDDESECSEDPSDEVVNDHPSPATSVWESTSNYDDMPKLKAENSEEGCEENAEINEEDGEDNKSRKDSESDEWELM